MRKYQAISNLYVPNEALYRRAHFDRSNQRPTRRCFFLTERWLLPCVANPRVSRRCVLASKPDSVLEFHFPGPKKRDEPLGVPNNQQTVQLALVPAHPDNGAHNPQILRSESVGNTGDEKKLNGVRQPGILDAFDRASGSHDQ